MADAQRPGEINYYDELGVAKNASADQIRDAFRTLARLLHPDQQTDPQLREAAERQMRKLNGIYATLSDPDRRASYDDSLRTPLRSSPVIVFSGSDPKLRRLLFRLGVIAFILIGGLAVLWAVLDNNNSSDGRTPSVRAAATGKSDSGIDNNGDAAEQIARLKSQLRTAETERNSALLQLDRLRQKAGGEAPAAEPRPAPAASAADEKQFAGTWVNSKAPASASPGKDLQYPPEFIELTITAANGSMQGKYRSRYQVLDHAISPDVNFEFTGVPGNGVLNCAWRGQGGARGRMTLKLTQSGTVQLAWNATELGTEQWLVNGTATLVRQ